MVEERSVEARVVEVVNEIVTLSEGAGRQTELEPLKLDSLDVTEMVMELEEEFDGLGISDDIVATWKTIGDIIDHVTARMTLMEKED